MDHMKILRRAWEITRSYRALWVFGILLALFTARNSGNGGGGGGGGGGGSSSLPNPGQLAHLASLRFTEATAQLTAAEWAIIAAVVVFGLLIVIAGAILRYVSETALIRMVDRHETSGERVTVGQGFRLGWSRAALRLFLIDLLIFVVGLLVFLLLGLIAAAPLLTWLSSNQGLRMVGGTIAIAFGILVFLLLILVVIVVSLLLQYIRRACVLEDRGVIESIHRGIEVLRGRLGDNIIMGLIVFALTLAITLVFIPIAIALILVGAVVGGLPGLLVGWIASLLLHGNAWIAGLVIGLPIFLVVVGLPLLFVGGLFETYKSTAWTLTYREAVALEMVTAEG